jgi:hypothetical protein
MGVTIPIAGRYPQLNRFPQHPEQNRMLARIIAGSNGVISDFILRTLPHHSFPSMPVKLLSHLLSNQLSEPQGSATGRVCLEPVVAFNDLHINTVRVFTQCSCGYLRQFHREVNRLAHVGSETDRNGLAGPPQFRLQLLIQPGGGDNQRNAIKETILESCPGTSVVRKVNHDLRMTSDGRSKHQPNRSDTCQLARVSMQVL